MTTPRVTETTMAPTRRSHKKSRNGCAECKRRHIRCDERRPSCANCEVAERTCSYPPSKTGTQQQEQGHENHAQQRRRRDATATPSHDSEMSSHSDPNINEEASAGHVQRSSPTHHPRSDCSSVGQAPSRLSVLTPDSLPSVVCADVVPHRATTPPSLMQQGDIHTTPPLYCPGLSDAVITADLTLQRMILLHHTHTVPNLIEPGRSVVDIAFRYATNAPYLMDEVLAFTAFHMTSIYPGSTVHLQRLATELQTRALASFTRLTQTVINDEQATAVPRFLFSAILGRHVLSDTLTHCRSDFHLFIDRFVECFDLNRSIIAVTPSARDYLNNSEAQPFFDVVIEAERKIITPGKECDALSRLMNDSDLNEASVKSCRQAIEVLQSSFDLCRNLEEEEYPQAASAFSVRIEAGFVDVLRKHRPEALAILAYYGVLLYRCRTIWAFADAGAPMIRAISGQLGSYWKEALAWPLHVLETERYSD